MRHVFVSLVLSGFALQATAAESGTVGKQAISACSLLTKELMLQVTPYEEQARDVVLHIPPSENPVGLSGSSCEYGGVNLQIDPFASPAQLEKELATKWTRVPGLGDVAYFRDNSGQWGELYVRAGAHVFTIQMGVPNGRTVESIKPNVVALANAILPKLK